MAAIDIDDQDALDDRERQESRIILQALQARCGVIGGEAVIPDDPKLTDRILNEARKLSAEISGSRVASVRTEASGGRAIPWWLWLAWPAAIVAVAAAFWWLHRNG